MATSLLPFEGPKRGRKCYATPAFSRIPDARDGEQKMRSGPQKRGTKTEVATSVLLSEGPKKGAEMLPHPCILGDPQR